ncbi:MAG: hypothetical protein ACO1QR_06265 [Chthoniobacteraceae bacterium]
MVSKEDAAAMEDGRLSSRASHAATLISVIFLYALSTGPVAYVVKEKRDKLPRQVLKAVNLLYKPIEILH